MNNEKLNKRGTVCSLVKVAKRAAVPLAVALISLARVAIVQAFTSGELSQEFQVLAGVTLAQSMYVLENTIDYEYGSRFVEKGAKVVQGVKDRCTNFVSGIANAFNWSNLPITCNTF